jgi:hypothetical protein
MVAPAGAPKNLAHQKAAFLRLLGAAEAVPAQDVAIHFLAAACDPTDEVCQPLLAYLLLLFCLSFGGYTLDSVFRNHNYKAQVPWFSGRTISRCLLVQVVSIAEGHLKKRCVFDGSKPNVNLEDKALVGRMFRLILGSPELLRAGHAAAAARGPEADSWVHPASHALQIRLLQVLRKSVAACNMNPTTLQVKLPQLATLYSAVNMKKWGETY